MPSELCSAATLAGAGGDGTVQLWDPLTGREVGEPLVRSPAAVSSLASCDAATADCVCVHGDGTVRTWTAATAALHSVTCPPDVSAIATVTSAGQASLLTGDIYGQIHHSRMGRRATPALAIDDRAVLAMCPLPGPAVRIAAAGGSGILVSGGHDGTIRLWDPITGTPGAVIPLGIPVHALLQQSPSPSSRERTGGGATITVGLRTGILALDLHHDMFPPGDWRCV